MEAPTPKLVLAADAAIDLQMHTTYSDGDWTPEQLVDYLVSEQFGLAAITDHDQLRGVPHLQRLGAEKGLPILAAVEMSTSWRGELTDVLCYGFIPGQNSLHDLAQSVVHRQQEITQGVYAELCRNGFTFPTVHDNLEIPRQPWELQTLLEQSGYSTGPGSIGKIITDAGFYFATNDIATIVEAAHQSGAVCIIAHPGRGGENTLYTTALLDELRQEVPFDGLEGYYPDHTPEQTAMYLDYAQKQSLLVSSGSDSHGPEEKPIKYRAELSRLLLERLGIKVE